MGTDARTAMLTSAQLLTLSQLFSPAYPVGGFSYSHGLEWLCSTGEISDVSDLRLWLKDTLRSGAGYADALFILAAFDASTPEEVIEIDDLCRAFAAGRERLNELDFQGKAFCEVTERLLDIRLGTLTFPVAVGRTAVLGDLPMDQTIQMYLHAFVSNLVAAGQRLFKLGQTDAQMLVHELAPLCAEIAEITQKGSLDDLSNTAFLSDIASMKHETQTFRIFRT